MGCYAKEVHLRGKKTTKDNIGKGLVTFTTENRANKALNEKGELLELVVDFMTLMTPLPTVATYSHIKNTLL